ncbi:MAG: hypothetical protein FJ390_05325 [Verrucomicrobia bacterium]|nr:hypothetical protein [Verrucomicrobiota bacterium]
MLKNIAPLFLALFFVTNQFVTGQTAPASPPNGLSSRVPPSFSLPKTVPLPPNSLPTSSTSNSSTGSSSGNSVNPPVSILPVKNPQLPTLPTAPTSPVNPPSNTGAPGLPALPPNSLPNTAIWLNPSNNNVLPVEVECDIAQLLVLQNNPVVAADGSTPFAVVAQVYTALLNLFATDDAPQKIMYTDSVKPFIDQHIDSSGNYFYTPVSGQENTLLGYSSCLSATTFRDQLCKDQNTFYTLDGNVDSNQQTYFWVHFSTFFLTTEDGSQNGLTHYQWINHTGIGNYYDFYFTKDHPDLSQVIPNSSDLCIRSLTASIWVGSRDDTNPTHDWTVTGNKSTGLRTSTDGAPFVQVPDNSSPSQENPAQPPADSNTPAIPQESSWDDFLQHGARSSWEAYLKQNASDAQGSSSN